jgi:hypothetical protein
MNDVECGDDVVRLREALRDIVLFKAYAVRNACCLGIRRRTLNAGPEGIIADVPRLGKRLGQLNERLPEPTAHVGHPDTALQFRLHVRHGGNPLLGEQILKPAVAEPLHAVPQVVIVGGLGTPLTQARAEAAMIIATDQGFPEQYAQAASLWGWALGVCGQGEEGRVQIQQGLAAARAIGAAGLRPYHLTLLVEVSAKVGQPPEALEALAEVLATVANSRVRWWEAELYRLRGELLLLHSVAQPGEAETCFQQTRAIARCQQAKSLELQAALSLGRLWQQQGKCAQSRALLAPVYGWFTEGFDTADLQEAKTLLEA